MGEMGGVRGFLSFFGAWRASSLDCRSCAESSATRRESSASCSLACASTLRSEISASVCRCTDENKKGVFVIPVCAGREKWEQAGTFFLGRLLF